MKKNITFVCLIGLPFISWSQNHRYTSPLFTSSSTITNIIYGIAPAINGPFYTVESSTTDIDLVMDIYTPSNDTFSLRPAIIFAHPGGFLIGDREVDDMNALCDTFARKGYVTATIDYRKGFNLVGNTDLHSTRAVYRGIQDGRSAVRYLRANAGLYGIDSSKIYFVGSSAGSFIGLHSIYIDTISEIPTQAGEVNYVNLTFPFSHTAPDLGPLDVGDYVSYNGKPDALVSMWGAVQNTDLISANNTTPVFLIHGESDFLVPFNSGPPFGYPFLPFTKGSNLINQKLDDLGFLNKETYFVPGEGHEFYGVSNGNWNNGSNGNAHYPVISDKITRFFWKQHKPTINFSWIQNALSVSFIDLSNGALHWYWEFGDGTISTDQNPTHVFTTPGTYTVKLYIENDIKSWNELDTILSVQNTALSAHENSTHHTNIYPNPTTGLIYIETPNAQEETSIEVRDILGRTVLKEINITEKGTLNLAGKENGIYILTIKNGDSITTQKIVLNN